MSTTNLSAPIIQSFSRVKNILHSCQSLDKTARNLSRRIRTLETNFQLEIESLLGGGVWEAGFSQNNPLLNEHSFESDSETSSGQLYPQFLNSMQTIRTVLENIVAILEDRVRDSAERDRALGIINPAAVGPRIISILRFCWWILMAIHGVLPIQYSEVLVFEPLDLEGNPKPTLERLLDRLGNEIEIISEVRQLFHESTSLGPGSSADIMVRKFFTRGQPAILEEPNLEQGNVTNSLGILHNLLSEELKCPCHVMHLCLAPPPAVPMDPVLTCSFFVTLNLIMPDHAARDHQYLTASRPPTHIPVLHPPPPKHSDGCSPITTLAEGSRHLLVHPPPTEIAFSLRSVRLQAGALNHNAHLNPPPILTLRELLWSHSRRRVRAELQVRDKLRLAVKLAQWAFQYNGTPWLDHLDTCNIRFFTRYEPDLNYGNWTPYLSAALNVPPPAHRERGGLYALGLVLLDLGLKKPFIGVPRNGEGNIKLNIAIRKLLTSVGLRYAAIVRELLLREPEGPISRPGNMAGYIEDTLVYFP